MVLELESINSLVQNVWKLTCRNWINLSDSCLLQKTAALQMSTLQLGWLTRKVERRSNSLSEVHLFLGQDITLANLFRF